MDGSSTTYLHDYLKRRTAEIRNNVTLTNALLKHGISSGKKYWSDGTPVAGQQFEYVHDDIGNRSSTKAGGAAPGRICAPQPMV